MSWMNRLVSSLSPLKGEGCFIFNSVGRGTAIGTAGGAGGSTGGIGGIGVSVVIGDVGAVVVIFEVEGIGGNSFSGTQVGFTSSKYHWRWFSSKRTGRSSRK